jgi:hypothetical protein
VANRLNGRAERRGEWSPLERGAGPRRVSQIVVAAENFPERRRFAFDFFEEQRFGEDDTPGPQRKNSKNKENNPCDYTRALKQRYQIRCLAFNQHSRQGNPHTNKDQSLIESRDVSLQ